MRSFRFVVLGVMVLVALAMTVLVAACGGDDQRDRTGIPEVDRVIEAVLSEDVDTLVALVRYEQAECSTSETSDFPEPPRCEAGQAEGSAVDVFVSGSCKPAYVSREEVPGFLRLNIEDAGLSVYAVYSTKSHPGLDSDYRVVFQGPEGREDTGGAGIAIDDGGIASLTFVCGSITDMARFLESAGADVILPPSGPLGPGEPPEAPAGTPVSGLTAPLDYGRFRLLPTGSIPQPCSIEAPPGLASDTGEIRKSATLDEFRDHSLFIEPPYIPTGWKLAEAHAETVVWDDASRTDSIFALTYARIGRGGISIGRRILGPDCSIERTEVSAVGQAAFVLSDIRAVPVLYEPDFRVTFVSDDVLTSVSGPQGRFDEVTKIADALIAELQESSVPS